MPKKANKNASTRIYVEFPNKNVYSLNVHNYETITAHSLLIYIEVKLAIFYQQFFGNLDDSPFVWRTLKTVI